MSLSGTVREAEQLYKLLEQIADKLKEINQSTGSSTVSESNKKMLELGKTLTELTTLIYGSLALIRRMGLPENVERAISQIMRLIATINMLRTSMIALMAASGPVGWVMAGIGIVGTAITIEQQLESFVA